MLTFAALCLLFTSVPDSRACSDPAQLADNVDTLLAEYDREFPPEARTAVTLQLAVRHAAVLDKRAAPPALHLLADLKMSWKDRRVLWNTTSWGCDSVVVSTERLWVPDVAFLNAGGARAGDEGLRARLFAAGRIDWTLRLDVAAPLALDLDAWPEDEQTAVFKFGSRSNDDLDLRIQESETDLVLEDGAWELVDLSGSVGTWFRAQGPAQVPQWAVCLRRRAAAQALATRTVLLAAIFTLAAAGMQPPATRAPLLAAATVTAALWLVTAASHLPPSATSPAYVIMFCGVCAAGAASGAAAALVARVAARAHPAPWRLRNALSAISRHLKLTPDPEAAGESGSGAWAAAARLLDAILLALIWTALVVHMLVCTLQ